MRLESMALSTGKAPATAKSSATIQSINPATGTLNATYDLTPATELPRIVENAHQAFLQWRQVPFTERSVPLRRVAATLREHERKYASLMAREMGKPIRGGVEEVRACAWLCDHFAQYAEDTLAREPVPTGARKSYISRDLPRGERIASELLEAGMAYVNHELYEDPRLPFGGIKESGYGREMGSYGIKEFVNIKTVYVA
jgi:acyl-CoA reductase-like NAD-dependent aldehyde dehydrogenase